ncbi:HotDog domain-containing protein [Annulohypoxylon truncatum]|uniref:HotDog domain-containing protein n=1 Tax=Annulohypoxylon truncatum TaxID=327061 RepID=UPI002007E8D6|nr:HotDog domain-containing protein [Annulohypoxylon truncatum]KAI1206866.1 HotDog domain-containing protein [Annulohypoxylon truncatum]
MPSFQITTSDYEHFASIPWCAKHLRGRRVISGSPASRKRKSNGEDSLYAETLKTQTTILAMLEVYEEPKLPTDRVDSLKMFLTLGSGLNGHPGICHGGIVVAILDEVIGLLIPTNQQRGTMKNLPFMTAYLNTTFLKPVPTCATIMARARILKVEGRKYHAEGWIEDGHGAILAHADALFVTLKSAL